MIPVIPFEWPCIKHFYSNFLCCKNQEIRFLHQIIDKKSDSSYMRFISWLALVAWQIYLVTASKKLFSLISSRYSESISRIAAGNSYLASLSTYGSGSKLSGP